MEALALEQSKNIQQLLILQAFYGTTFCQRDGMDLVATFEKQEGVADQETHSVTAY
jgi:hypothetical protein